ncbi:MAG TPA: chemotaxis protein CheB [Coleofasciculaceae cyanobacterium]
MGIQKREFNDTVGQLPKGSDPNSTIANPTLNSRNLLLNPSSTKSSSLNCTYELVVLGTSLGGLQALEVLLKGLPKTFPMPIAIVQHRHRGSDETLSVFLQRYCALPLTEVEDKEIIRPGQVYLAPADYHLLIELGWSWEHETDEMRNPSFALSTEAPVCHARPSIDALFESAADAFGERVIGVVLTGASHDGAQGLLKIKARGGLAVIQEPKTAQARIMPQAAIAAVPTAKVLPLAEIAPFLVHLCHPAPR